MEEFVLPLRALDRSSLGIAGGKGANLGELLRAGLAVPDGFCVTTAAYRRFVAASGIAGRLEALLAGLTVEDTAALVQAGSAARALFTERPIPAGIAAAVRQAAVPFAGKPLAVRSSATAEDLPEASFAGQQDTYLNVIGEEALLDAVRRCWASLWTDRAIAYRQRNAIPHSQVALAVVVQAMVPAEAAGVLFTANPVSGKRTEAVIDASLGLGEAVVSGAVAPDNYLVDKRGLSILSRVLGTKQVQVVALPDGGTEKVEVTPDIAARPALPDPAVRALVRVGNAIEAHFGAPQDVEWAFANGRLFILQSRPITSLHPLPPTPADGQLHIYLSLNSMQGMLEPFTPMGASLFTEMSCLVFVGGDRKRVFVHEVAGRLYVDATPVLRGPLGDPFVRLVLPEVEPVIGRILKGLLEEGRLGTPGRLHRRSVVRFFLRYRRNLTFIAQRVIQNLASPAAARARLRTEIVPTLTRLRAETQKPLPLGEQVSLLYDIVARSVKEFLFFRLVTLVIPSVAAFKRAEIIVRDEGLDEHLLNRVRRGLRYNVTTTMDLDLWALAKQVKGDPAARTEVETAGPGELAARYGAGSLLPVVQEGTRQFLRRYGHRGVREIDLGIPRWGEDPTYLFGVLKNYLALEDPDAAPDVHFARQTKAAEAALAELVRQANHLPGGRRKAAMLGFFLSRFRELGGLREAPKFYVMWLFRTIREMMLVAGRELVAQGRLARAEDVFFLRLPELEAAGRETRPYVDLVAERRRAYERELARPHAPRVLSSEGEAFYGAVITASEGALVGTGASPGLVRGRVRVVRDPIGARLQPGEILVSPSTDPAWTPLFLTAGGLVMEAGGMMSHGSIVAREYGIPAVVGVAEATIRLKDGEEIEVDGHHGLVRIIGQAER